jgi:predicted N-acyltransferase
MEVISADTVRAVPPAIWDATVGPGGFYAASGWLAVAEATADRPPVYLRTAGGSLPCYELAADSPVPFCRADVVAAGALGPDADLMPSLFCGGRNPAHTTVHATGDRPATVDALVARAETVARERDLRSVGLLYVDGDDTVVRETLARRGFLGFPHEPAAVLAVPPGGFEAYLATLPSKARVMVRGERRRLAGAGVTMSVRPLTPDLLDTVDALEDNVNDRYGRPFDRASVRHLRTVIAARLPGEVRVALAERDRQPCGSVLFFHWRDELYARTVGFDYAVQGRLPVYFGLVFYTLVEYAQRVGATRIRYSTGADRAKRSRGCALVAQYAYLKHLDRVRHAALVRRYSGGAK